MALYLKRLVSGHKARFRDASLGIELDLAYVSDRVIVMGFPAVGVEGIYRNHRADVQRFLSARHGSDFWVFNFCPVRENAYHEDVFQGRVSRYPFPDHHVPPFLYFSLVTREMHAWLSGSDARVAVLHCKAGKGRSGTLACAYLLFLDASLSTSIPSLQDGVSEWSLIADKEALLKQPTSALTMSPATPGRLSVHSASAPPGADLSRVASEPGMDTLEKILDLHTSRRMKASLHRSRYRKPKMGVSIPSQQRWLSYWSQILAGTRPPSSRLYPPVGRLDDHEHQFNETLRPTKVKLIKLAVRMRQPSWMQPHLVHAASVMLTSAGKRRAVSESTTGKLWASLARYSDQFVDELEHWEKESHSSGDTVGTSPFRDDRWDKAKMIRSFAQMRTSDIQSTQDSADQRSPATYVLRPLDDDASGWVRLRRPAPESDRENPRQHVSILENSPPVLSEEDDDSEDSSGIVLEADRELRIKLFMGEITLGWVWLIPAFHMSPDSPSCSLVLSNADIDFAIGIGKAIVDMKISLAWHVPRREDGE